MTPKKATFTFYVRLASDGGTKQFDTFTRSSTFEQIQSAISAAFGFKSVECVMFHKGKILDKGPNFLADYGIDDGDTIVLHEQKTSNSSEDDLVEDSEPASDEPALSLLVKLEPMDADDADDADTESSCGNCMSREADTVQETIHCDDCRTWFHWQCLDPPMTALPKSDDWYCSNCRNDPDIVVHPDNEAEHTKSKQKTKKPVPGMANVKLSRQCPLPKNHRGAIPGIDVGQLWIYRKLCAEDGVHRPIMTGIHGSVASGGCVSICMNGGYDTNDDHGAWFFYTGSGGFEEVKSNSQKATARTGQKQVKDQEFKRGNLAIAVTCDARENKNGAVANDWRQSKAIRIVRGSKTKNIYSPKQGFRYDGIYKLVRYDLTEPVYNGHRRYIFEFRRDDPSPAPWTDEGKLKIKQLGLKMQTSSEGSSSRSPDATPPESEEGPSLANFPTIQWKIPDAIQLAMAEAVSVIPDHQRIFGPILAVRFSGSYDFTRFLYENITCGICMEFVDHPVTNICGHITCLKCITRWVKKEHRCHCPLCQLPLSGSTREEGSEDSESANSLERKTILDVLKVDVYIVKFLRLCLRQYCEDVDIITQGPSTPVNTQQELDNQIAEGMYSFSFDSNSKWSGEDSISSEASVGKEDTVSSFMKQKTIHYTSHTNRSQPDRGFQEQQDLHRTHHSNQGDSASEISADSWDYISCAEQRESQLNQGGDEVDSTINNSVTQQISRAPKRTFSQINEGDDDSAASSSANGQSRRRGDSGSKSSVEDSENHHPNRSTSDEDFRREFPEWF